METTVAVRSPPSSGRRRPHNHGSSGGRGHAGGRRAPMVEKSAGRSLVMEEVTILKRGEHLKPPPPPLSGEPLDDVVFSSTGRLGPEPEILPTSIGLRRADTGRKVAFGGAYAGSGFIASPAPSSVPLPTSFLPKDKSDIATRSLRFLLRLDVP